MKAKRIENLKSLQSANNARIEEFIKSEITGFDIVSNWGYPIAAIVLSRKENEESLFRLELQVSLIEDNYNISGINIVNNEIHPVSVDKATLEFLADSVRAFSSHLVADVSHLGKNEEEAPAANEEVEAIESEIIE